MFAEKAHPIEAIVLIIKLGIRTDFLPFVSIKGPYMSCIIARTNVKVKLLHLQDKEKYEKNFESSVR